MIRIATARQHQTNLVSKFVQLPRAIMRRGTCFCKLEMPSEDGLTLAVAVMATGVTPLHCRRCHRHNADRGSPGPVIVRWRCRRSGAAGLLRVRGAWLSQPARRSNSGVDLRPRCVEVRTRFRRSCGGPAQFDFAGLPADRPIRSDSFGLDAGSHLAWPACRGYQWPVLACPVSSLNNCLDQL